MPHSNCLCPSPSPSSDCWKGCLPRKSLTTSGQRDGVACQELSIMKGLYFIPFSSLDFSDEQLYSSHLEKLVCFKSVVMKRLLMCANVPLPMSLQLGDKSVGDICEFYWERERERENLVLDRHGKGIRQMCCCVWVDWAPGFYCCSSRGPLGALNLPVKFWASQT